MNTQLISKTKLFLLAFGKHLIYVFTALLLSSTVLASSEAFAGSSATVHFSSRPSNGYGFDEFLERYEAANTAFVNGDPSLWLSITAEKNPVSIFGGFGGLGEAGLEDVNQRYLLAARAFQPSGAQVEFEYLVKDIRGRLAYTVAIERSEVLYAGQPEKQPQILRVTMIFRFDKGAWKIVHRHADMMIDLQLPQPPTP